MLSIYIYILYIVICTILYTYVVYIYSLYNPIRQQHDNEYMLRLKMLHLERLWPSNPSLRIGCSMRRNCFMDS